jgi:hypothetical protein
LSPSAAAEKKKKKAAEEEGQRASERKKKEKKTIEQRSRCLLFPRSDQMKIHAPSGGRCRGGAERGLAHGVSNLMREETESIACSSLWRKRAKGKKSDDQGGGGKKALFI